MAHELTWRVAIPIIIAALEDGTPEGKRLAREELLDLAKRLDAMNGAVNVSSRINA